MSQEGVRLNTGLVSIVAAATSTTLWTLSTSHISRARIKKLFWRNRSGANADLTIGYTTLGGAFVPVAPNILMLNGIDGQLNEEDLPIMGNTPEGFAPDTTAGTGTLGNIIVRSSVAAAAPADVQVMAEIEEI